jgi:hypothetical protein
MLSFRALRLFILRELNEETHTHSGRLAKCAIGEIHRRQRGSFWLASTESHCVEDIKEIRKMISIE